jgi:hypothetical protein
MAYFTLSITDGSLCTGVSARGALFANTAQIWGIGAGARQQHRRQNMPTDRSPFSNTIGENNTAAERPPF